MIVRLAMLPVNALVRLVQELRDRAEAELFDEATIRRELLELESSFRSGELSEAEFEECEALLLARLHEGRRRRMADEDDEVEDAEGTEGTEGAEGDEGDEATERAGGGDGMDDAQEGQGEAEEW